jgi:hypothetical protein
MRRWRIHFITASWDEPGDTVIPVVDESGGLVEASSQQEAETKFAADPRARFYVEEGGAWAVPEGVRYWEYVSEGER